PVIIQSDFGNFEMVVPQGDSLQHYWRDNADRGQPWQYANHPWHKGFEIVPPGDIVGVGTIKLQLDKVAFFQSRKFRSGPGNHGNFEALVHITKSGLAGGSGPGLGGGIVPTSTGDSLYTYIELGHHEMDNRAGRSRWHYHQRCYRQAYVCSKRFR